MDAIWRVELLGGLRAVRGRRVVSRFRTQRTASLFAYLSLNAGRSHPREVLIEEFWPHVSAGRQSLSQALSSIRNQLEPPGVAAGAVLSATRSDVRLTDGAVAVDLWELRAGLDRARSARSEADRREALREALALDRGPLLPALYDDWVLRERASLLRLILDARMDAARLGMASGDLEEAAEHLERAIAEDELHEPAHRELIRVHLARGNAAGARHQFEVIADLLRRELDQEPEPETRQVLDEPPPRLPADRAATARRPRRKRRAPAPVAVVSDRGTKTLLAVVGSDEEPDPDGDIETVIEAVAPLGAHSVMTESDEAVLAFPTASDALAAGLQIQARDPRRWRLGLHSTDVMGETEAGDATAQPSIRLVRSLANATPSGHLVCTESTAALLDRQGDLGASPIDLGLYRVTPDRAEHVFALLSAGDRDAERPVLDLPTEAPIKLPVTATRFFGRVDERHTIAHHLGQGSRLTSISGPGGTGKTRLALEAARGLGTAAFPGGIWFVPLAGIHDANVLTDVILDVLEVTRDGARSPLATLAGAIETTRTLIVLDNFEQLVPDGIDVVHEMLADCPGLSLLVTTRRLLRLDAEREVPLHPLPVPDENINPERLLEHECAQLFVDRAILAAPDFQVTKRNAATVARICRRLEGIPLALELAAARISVIGPTAMLGRLEKRLDFLTSTRRDIEPRHRTLRAATEWSYRLLDPTLRAFFAGLSVFRTRFTLEAAEHVTEDELALDRLAQLRDSSLLETVHAEGDVRFQMLDTIREFADDQLSLRARRRLEDRYVDYYIDMLEAVGNTIGSDRLAAAWDMMAREVDHHRAVIDILEARAAKRSPAGRQALDRAIGAVSRLARPWGMRGLLGETRRRLDQLLTLAPARHDSAALLSGVMRSGYIAMAQGDLAPARITLDRGLRLARRRGDGTRVAWALTYLSAVERFAGDIDAARRLSEQAVVVHVENNDWHGEANALQNLGGLDLMEGRLDTAREHIKRSLDIRREHDDIEGVTSGLSALGLIAMRSGDLDGADRYLREALELRERHGLDMHIPAVKAELAVVTARRGDPEAARVLLGESLRAHREHGNRRGMATALTYFGGILIDDGEVERGLELLTVGGRIRDDIGVELAGEEKREVGVWVEKARAALGDARYSAVRRSAEQRDDDEVLVRASLPRNA